MLNWDNSSLIQRGTNRTASNDKINTSGFEVKIKDVKKPVIIVEEEIGADETWQEG